MQPWLNWNLLTGSGWSPAHRDLPASPSRELESKVPHHLQPKSNIVYRYQVKEKEIDSVTLRFIIAFTLLMVNLQLW